MTLVLSEQQVRIRLPYKLIISQVESEAFEEH